ncbi:MAG: FtsX-like permease family protein [Clostridiales Family XIII bacterium]|jgi:putative ABC transport system permease protein|nr:FtsX-like permease family protein [Clostridiales Family XIII bacterium]
MLMKKMLRDMNRHKSQFVSIFLMAFLAVFIYTGVGAEWRGLQKSSDEFYEETNLSNVWIYSENVTDNQAKSVKDVKDVDEVERRLEVDIALPYMENSPKLTLNFLEKNKISMPQIIEGSNFDINDADGIWLDKRFADANKIKVSDTFIIPYNNTDFAKTVRGLIASPERVFLSDSDTLTPDFGANGCAFLSAKAFPFGSIPAYNTLLVTTNPSHSEKANSAYLTTVEDKITKALDGKFSVYLNQKDNPSVSTFHNEVLQHKMMGDIFPVAFLLIALLTMLTTMTRLVTNQRIQIGTLKALGFKKFAILRHYIAYGFFLSLLGSLCGLFVGPVTLPKLFIPSMSSFYTLPTWKTAYSGTFFVVAGLMVALGVLVTFLACNKLLHDTPADTLRPKAPTSFKHHMIEKTALWQYLGFNAQWNFRDASRNRLRALMAIIGVLGCTALIICAITMNTSMNDLKNWQYEDINKFESKMLLNPDVTENQVKTIMQMSDGEAIMEASVELRADDIKKTGALCVTDNTTLISPTDVHFKPIKLPSDGISVTAKMANLLHVEKGDVIEWKIYGSEEWHKSKILAIYREPVSQGISMGRAYLEAQDIPFKATSVLSSEDMKPQTAQPLLDGVDTVLSTADTIAGWNDLTEAMYIMVYVLILAAAVLAIVVLYNLGLLSFTEMEREMATLKVMGLKSGKLRSLLLTQSIWFSVIGFIPGIPCGIGLVILLVNSTGEAFDYPVMLHISTVLISFVFTFGISILVNLLFSRKIRKLNMVESLKAME